MDVFKGEGFDVFKKLFVKLTAPKLSNKVAFFRLLSITQKAGLGVRDSLLTILKSEKHTGMRTVIADVIDQVGRGSDISSAMIRHSYFFSVDEIEQIKSSEKMGNMPDVLQNIADDLEKFQEIKTKVKGAMMYPIFVIIVAVVAVILLLTKVVPTIVDLFPPGAKLPYVTVLMINLSDIVKQYWYLVALGIVSFFITFVVLYNKLLAFKIFVDRYMLKIPVLGDLVVKFNHYRFSKLLGDFYTAGVSPVVALENISNTMNNFHYKHKVLNIKTDLEIGLGFAESMDGSWLFESILVQVISIGEDTGNIGEVLNKMADFYREEVMEKVSSLVKLVEPLLMVGVAVIIGGVVAAVMLPLGDLIGSIG